MENQCSKQYCEHEKVHGYPGCLFHMQTADAEWRRSILDDFNIATCPDCGSAMWDNRENKKTEKSPNFVCKQERRECKNYKGYPTSYWNETVSDMWEHWYHQELWAQCAAETY